MTAQILQGDCREILKTLPSQSVQCCITSPPYWGLRNYGHADQLGLETTPQAYVDTMRGLFAEIWRVLKDDGTVWLNLGDSYNSGPSGGLGGSTLQGGQENQSQSNRAWRNGSGRADGKVDERAQRNRNGVHAAGLKHKDLCGIPWRVAFALQAPYPVPTCVTSEIDRAWLAAMFDGEGCIGIRRFDSYREDKQQVYQDGFVVYTTVANNDVELLEKGVSITGRGKLALKAVAGTGVERGIVSRRDSFVWRLDGNGAVDVIRAIYPYLIAKRKQACIAYTLDQLNKHGHVSRSVPADIQDKKRFLWGLIKGCNQRQPVDIPSWIEEPKQEIIPGWYLRSDIIWHKPNPMPESVRDRPTRAHEYIFLLTKSARYYYDHEAIKEPASPALLKQIAEGYSGQATKAFNSGLAQDASATKSRIIDGYRKRIDKQRGYSRRHQGFNDRWDQLSREEQMACGSNKRSVWTVAPANYPEAHFATFPPNLIQPCILAGTKPGDVVLDPFFGSGTTGQVALELGRKCIGIELNPEYVALATQRCHVTPGLNLA